MPTTPAVPDGKRPTLAHVAARAGVSVALVSIVMRGAYGASATTRERVLKAAEEIGYRPDTRARVLRSNRSRLLGVQFGLRHPFHTDLVEGIYVAAEPAGYQVALSAVAPTRGERQAVEALLADRCEALVLLGPEVPAARLAHLATQVPVVSVARWLRPAPPAVDVVRTADDEGARQAVDHLVALGHRAIAHIDGGRAPGAADRRRGYRTAMHRHGLDDHVRVLPGGLTEDDGARAARSLVAENPGPARSSPSTTGAPRASSTPSCGPVCPSPARSPWSASTTPACPGSPTSTSRPSPRMSRASRNSPSAAPSPGWTARP